MAIKACSATSPGKHNRKSILIYHVWPGMHTADILSHLLPCADRPYVINDVNWHTWPGGQTTCTPSVDWLATHANVCQHITLVIVPCGRYTQLQLAFQVNNTISNSVFSLHALFAMNVIAVCAILWMITSCKHIHLNSGSQVIFQATTTTVFSQFTCTAKSPWKKI